MSWANNAVEKPRLDLRSAHAAGHIFAVVFRSPEDAGDFNLDAFPVRRQNMPVKIRECHFVHPRIRRIMP
jgi:hypothetical protein